MRSLWKSSFVTFLLVALDVIALSIIWREAWEIRNALNGWHGLPIVNPYADYRQAFPLLLVVWLAIMAFFKQYAHQGKISSLNQLGDIIKTGIMLFLVTMAVAHGVKRQHDLGNSVISLAANGIVIYLYASRSCLRLIKEKLRERGHGLIRVVIIGAGETGRQVSLRIQNHPEVGYELVGFIDKAAAKLGKKVAGVPVIGDSSDLVNLLLRYRVEEVFLAIPSLPQNDAFALVVQCESANVHFKIVRNDLLQVITDRVKIDDIGDFPVILLREGKLTAFDALIKRAVDLIVAIPMFIGFMPLYLLIALLIKLDSRGAILFCHERVGQNGKIFRLCKFRTMGCETSPYAVAPGDQSDPRITRFGRLLRKSSLDELPQFWNVIRGDMSMVGPRPEMPFIVSQYEPWQRRRLDVPQGLTGLWQIAGRKQLPLHYNLEYDFYYIRNWSLLLDIVIILRTIPAVIFCKGAF